MLATIDGNFVGLGVELKNDEAGLKLVGVIRGGPGVRGRAEGGRPDRGRRRPVGPRARARRGGRPAPGDRGDAGRYLGAPIPTVDQDLPAGPPPRRGRERRKARIVDPISGVGYIQLTGFQKSSTEELDRAIAKLKRQGMRYLVLDLRGNPGGLLNVSVDIADRFLDQGVIVSTRGRAPGQTQVYRARPDKPYAMPCRPIDHDSASASEILAGALQELGRAVVIGDRSYGKGSVQSIFAAPFGPGGPKLTTAKFYSPKNRAYSEQGVTPDIPVVLRAKPAADAEPEADPQEFGDPVTDRVLDIALQQARRQLTSSR